jgi:hypothetical protein
MLMFDLAWCARGPRSGKGQLGGVSYMFGHVTFQGDGASCAGVQVK